MKFGGIKLNLSKSTSKNKATQNNKTKSKRLSIFNQSDKDDVNDEEEKSDDENNLRFKKENGNTRYTLLNNDKKPQSNASLLSKSLKNIDLIEKQQKDDDKKLNDEFNDAIYGYDEVYDIIKTAERSKQKEIEDDLIKRQPKYMDKLLEARSIRNKDKIRSMDLKIKRTRLKEGNEFNNKEEFITDAYKEQQEELNKQQLKDELNDLNNIQSIDGLKNFRKKLLDETENEHDAIMQIAEKKIFERINGIDDKSSFKVIEEEDTEEAKLLKQAKEINKKAGYEKVAINESGEIVDNLDLLSSGLNIIKKPQSTNKSNISNTSNINHHHRDSFHRNDNTSKHSKISRKRETEEVIKQLEIRERERKRQKQDLTTSIISSVKAKKTSSDIASARERYLARKKKANENT